MQDHAISLAGPNRYARCAFGAIQSTLSGKTKTKKGTPVVPFFQSMPRCDSGETHLLLVEFHLRLEFGWLLLNLNFSKIRINTTL